MREEGNLNPPVLPQGQWASLQGRVRVGGREGNVRDETCGYGGEDGREEDEEGKGGGLQGAL